MQNVKPATASRLMLGPLTLGGPAAYRCSGGGASRQGFSGLWGLPADGGGAGRVVHDGVRTGRE